MKMTEIRELSEKDLKEKLTSLRQELFNLRFQHATAQLEKTASIPATKKDIARVLTVMSEKGIKA
ncbi:50S ribosomal protein L29 [Taurinivorans muris]|jgi:ribosomal protein L29|uniref:Large ribosomal subunit protein uL29 n=1 Tax=Taurinivorans muris TaxID=2787751 RepID=A0ABY5XYK4_9BACT|nr:50S ribosomal protein L29 [Mailhella sp.]MDE7011666.1 50S ribosomal protein L29 [Mailhella sp.]UWX04968.1 50S ribosomal protein L29 [Desulfovibrionaceae bacterium LT0009]